MTVPVTDAPRRSVNVVLFRREPCKFVLNANEPGPQSHRFTFLRRQRTGVVIEPVGEHQSWRVFFWMHADGREQCAFVGHDELSDH